MLEVQRVCSEVMQSSASDYQKPALQIFKIHTETSGGIGSSNESKGGLLLAS